ncbi:Clavaminate synthase-like protein [Exidia glandulosa HHB12029]|uniref:Clavaminate synthase-like protein n=1 Tax=Exidia glandulosa HHB12029 TaxID=1314781 RepID=A0A165AVY2_EXIGL|nr:Clavaminate synthase-like protein [Exidia glandulosa HHB12029]
MSTLGSYTFVEETKADLPWAELVTLDLAKFHTPEGRKELASFLIKALREKGFFYVKNFNISQEAVNRQFAIGRRFYELPLEEKEKYVPKGLDDGKFNGYVPAGRRILNPETGLRDRVEVYNIPSRCHSQHWPGAAFTHVFAEFNGSFEHDHPEVIEDNLPEIEAFARSLHSEVLDPLHALLAIALELPEDYFTNIHKYNVKSEDHLRYMKYSKFTPEENESIGNMWGGGHTDLGSFTLLFRQPVAALQIRDPLTHEWRWVKPQDATLTVNACDMLSFLTGGYVQSTVHRVASMSIAWREGFTQNQFEKSGNPVPTVEEFTFAKQKWQRRKNVARGDPNYRTATILPGFSEQVYA